MPSLFEDLRNVRYNSAFARLLLRAYYKDGIAYTVPFGLTRGLKMYYDPAMNFHDMLGLRDKHIFRLLGALFNQAVLKSSSIICDGGANVGTYSLWFGRAASAGHVYSFEPNPEARSCVSRNVMLNGLKNVTIVDSAISGSSGTTAFFLGRHHATSSIFQDSADRGEGVAGKVVVSTVSMDDFFFSDRAVGPPDLIKLDIEGACVDALRACSKCVQAKRPLFLIESHNPAEDKAIGGLIMENDYRAYRIEDQDWVRNPSAVHPDPEGVFGTLFIYPAESHAILEPLIKSAR